MLTTVLWFALLGSPIQGLHSQEAEAVTPMAVDPEATHAPDAAANASQPAVSDPFRDDILRQQAPHAVVEPTADAFCEIPLARPIQRQGDTDAYVPPTQQKSVSYCCRFAAPAHFPLTEFGPEGESIEREGAVIYEGMRLSVDPEGRYELQFVVTTPALPTRLRLQLEIVHEIGAEAHTHTLTLPPIEIPHGFSETGTSSFAVNARGFSPVLRDAARTRSILEVRRMGTARFGYDRANAER